MSDGPPDDKLIDLSRPLGARPIADADFRLMVEAVTDYAIFLLDVNGAIRSWNVGAERLKQYTASEVLGQHFSIFYPQEIVDRAWPAYELAEAERVGRFEDEGWRVRKDGTRFWANIIITRLTGTRGELRGFCKITRDLTNRRNNEEQLRLSEERFRLLVENVKDCAIYMIDPSGYVMSWNSGAEKSKGYTAAEIIGKHFSVFYPSDLVATGAPQLELKAALDSGTYQDEGWRVHKDGSRFWASVVLTAIKDEKGRHRGFAKITRDLTESRKIRALEDEGRRITEFLAMLGHELRNPLAPILNAVSLIETLGIESTPLKRAGEIIARQATQLSHLVDDLLDMSRITNGKVRLDRKPTQMQTVVAQAIEAVEPMVINKSHTLTSSLDPEAQWVSGDRARLVQIVTNLLHNAVKFTPARGRINVVLRGSPDAVAVRVSDNGVGIPLHLQANIFNLFVQGETDSARASGGLGLGLSLARRLAVLHAGEVTLYSKGTEGSGSEFVLSLPTIKAPLGHRSVDARARKKVWIVDDNRDSADTLAMLLETADYDTGVSYDGSSGLASVIAEMPDFVLLDLALPGLTGLEVAARVRAEMEHPPHLIAVSGYNQDADREATFKFGFAAHMRKPVSFNELTALLKRLLD